MCVSIYGVCLVGKAQQWCLVEDVGTLWKWKSGFGKFIENIVWLWFWRLDACIVWLWF